MTTELVLDQPRSSALEVVPTSALEVQERASIDSQVATAKRYPRSYSKVKQNMLSLVTLDVETAESCFYKLNRQGKNIEGPSIRLAEIAASCFGNIRYASRVVDNDGKTVTAQGFCHDTENNVLFTSEVKRRITGKDGRTYSEDMQVVTGNAACAIAARNALFKIVPFALIKPIYEAAKQTAVGDLKTLPDRRARMLKAFGALGVNQTQILAKLAKPGVEDIGLGDIETLIGLHTAIKEGDTTVDEAFAAEQKPAPALRVADVPPAAPASAPASELPTPAAPEPPADAAVPPALASIRSEIESVDIPESELAAELVRRGNLKAGSTTLDKLAPQVASLILEQLPDIVKSIHAERERRSASGEML